MIFLNFLTFFINLHFLKEFFLILKFKEKGSFVCVHMVACTHGATRQCHVACSAPCGAIKGSIMSLISYISGMLHF